MGFFNWAAPFMQRYGERWTDEETANVVGRLRPYVPSGGRMLDVGGGTGGLAIRLAEALGARVTILDPTPEMVAYVPSRDDVDVVIGSAEEIPFEADLFDAAIASDAFHHFADQSRAVDEMARVVRPGGGLHILELDPTRLFIRLVALAERLLREPGSFLTPKEMCEFMAEHGVEGHCESEDGTAYYFIGTVQDGKTRP